MSLEGNGGASIPLPKGLPHYFGHSIRVIFIANALALVLAASTGATLPLSTGGAVITAVILVAAAGITHPRIRWIHWVNAFIAVWGTILFGTSAVTHYRAGGGVLDTTFIYTEALALLFLGAVYFVTRTIRGFLQQDQQQG